MTTVFIKIILITSLNETDNIFILNILEVYFLCFICIRGVSELGLMYLCDDTSSDFGRCSQSTLLSDIFTLASSLSLLVLTSRTSSSLITIEH